MSTMNNELYSEQDFKNSKSRDKLSFRCTNCNKIFKRYKNQIQTAIKHGINIKFCSKQCHFDNLKNEVELNCIECNILFKRSKCYVINDTNHFCSRSCSAKWNNRVSQKRYKTKKCIYCDTLINKDRKYCSNHSPNRDMSIEEMLNDHTYKSNAYTSIRSRARYSCKNRIQECNNCGWDKHVQCCHIKPIKSFTRDTLVSVVNEPSNLILLCPNCHWLLDNNQLNISGLCSPT